MHRLEASYQSTIAQVEYLPSKRFVHSEPIGSVDGKKRWQLSSALCSSIAQVSAQTAFRVRTYASHAALSRVHEACSIDWTASGLLVPPIRCGLPHDKRARACRVSGTSMTGFVPEGRVSEDVGSRGSPLQNEERRSWSSSRLLKKWLARDKLPLSRSESRDHIRDTGGPRTSRTAL